MKRAEKRCSEKMVSDTVFRHAAATAVAVGLEKGCLTPFFAFGRSFDDLRDEVQAALDGRRIALVKLAHVRFRDDVLAQPLGPIERVRHRLDAVGRHGRELPDHLDDVRQLRGEIGRLVGADLETGELAESIDVSTFERHWPTPVTDVSLKYTRRLPILPPVAKVAPPICRGFGARC